MLLYEKRGRRYFPAFDINDRPYESDLMRVGTFRLTYAYAGGARRYEYDVTPETAPLRAAMMKAKQAMEDAMQEAMKPEPQNRHTRQWTDEQKAIIARFREDMHKAGGWFPEWWTHETPSKLVDAAIKALEDAE